MNIREMIDSAVTSGDNEVHRCQYRKAYFEYEGAISLLSTLDIKYAKNRTMGSIAGWTAGMLTGGIGFEDLFIIPLVKGGVEKMLGSDEDYLKYMLQGVLLKQVNTLLLDSNLANNISIDSVLTKFCILVLSFTPENTFSSAGRHYLPRLGKDKYFNNPDFSFAPRTYLETHAIDIRHEAEMVFRLLFRFLSIIHDQSTLRITLEHRYSNWRQNDNDGKNSQEQSIPPNNNRFDGNLTEDECFLVLQIPSGSTKEEIKAAYLKLSKLYHPDKYAHLAPEFQELAGERMKIINQAYNILINQ